MKKVMGLLLVGMWFVSTSASALLMSYDVTLDPDGNPIVEFSNSDIDDYWNTFFYVDWPNVRPVTTESEYVEIIELDQYLSGDLDLLIVSDYDGSESTRVRFIGYDILQPLTGYHEGRSQTGGQVISRYSIDLSSYLSSLDDDSTTVPEPSTLILLGAGLAGLGFTRKFRKN